MALVIGGERTKGAWRFAGDVVNHHYDGDLAPRRFRGLRVGSRGRRRGRDVPLLGLRGGGSPRCRTFGDAPQIAARIQRHHEPLAALIDDEVLRHREKPVHRLHRARAEIGKSRIAVDVSVLNDQIVSDLHEGAVAEHLLIRRAQAYGPNRGSPWRVRRPLRH
jgi:hypothetical protein